MRAQQSDSNDLMGRVTVTEMDGSWASVTVYMSCHGAHRDVVESLRGTNRNQRVETVRCLDCGRIERRVWLGLPAQRKPDRTYPLRESYSATAEA